MNLFSYLSQLGRMGGAFPPMYSSRQQSLDIGEMGPPAASGVRPGQAYPDYSGEPTVIVNQPSAPAVNIPSAGPPPANWIYPQPAPMAGYPDMSNAPMVTVDPTLSGASAPDWMQNAMANSSPWQQNATQPFYAGPGYTDPRVANAFFGGLANWNAGGWAANPGGGESGFANEERRMGPVYQAHHQARIGGKGAGGVMPVKYQ